MHSSSSQRNWSSVSGQYCPMGRGASRMSLPMRPFRAAHRLKGLHTSCMHQLGDHRLTGISGVATCRTALLPVGSLLPWICSSTHTLLNHSTTDALRLRCDTSA